jgi:hypothetical protein
MNDTLAGASPVDQPVGRPVPELLDDAVRLANRMAKAAGPQRADTMARACYMLLCTAALVSDPESYFDWLDQMKENA